MIEDLWIVVLASPKSGIRGAIAFPYVTLFAECCIHSTQKLSKSSDQGVSHSISNTLSPKFFFHNIAIIKPLDIILLLICRRRHWPVKTHVPSYQIVYKGYKIGSSIMNILNMSLTLLFLEEYILRIFDTAAESSSYRSFVLHGDGHREPHIYSSCRRNHSPVSLRPFGARSSH
jgi:hypothetical protein